MTPIAVLIPLNSLWDRQIRLSVVLLPHLEPNAFAHDRSHALKMAGRPYSQRMTRAWIVFAALNLAALWSADWNARQRTRPK
jgi:hypothetical protein